MTRGAWGAALALGVVLAGAPGCEDETIVLATVAKDDSGAPVTGLRCQVNADCPGGFCSMTVCGAVAGTCDVLPTHCESDALPVCGCDGITYFNDCLRRAAGVLASTPGRCPFATAIMCGGHAGVPCPDGSRCAQLVGLGERDCPHDAAGSCWVLPFNCPPTTPHDDPWIPCGPPGPRCVDMCTAIKSGIPHRLADACP